MLQRLRNYFAAGIAALACASAQSALIFNVDGIVESATFSEVLEITPDPTVISDLSFSFQVDIADVSAFENITGDSLGSFSGLTINGTNFTADNSNFNVFNGANGSFVSGNIGGEFLGPGGFGSAQNDYEFFFSLSGFSFQDALSTSLILPIITANISNEGASGPFGGGLSFTSDTRAGSVTISAAPTSVPAPPTLASFSLALVFLVTVRHRCAKANRSS